MLDPLPTWLAKGCSAELILLITNIVNTSMSTGTVPDSFKVAHVTPVLKKTSLDRNCLKNYRPISNLSFVSKVLEKTVLSRLMDYLTQENLLEPYQSAYKSGHSTETALNAVHNFITSKLDEDCFVLLVLLDLSSAFDTVNHSILLKDCSQITGVPQGSVLGPVLFSLYLAELSDIIRHHGVHFHHYADDTQLLLAFDKDDVPNAFHKMETCISAVNTWLTTNQLKLNCDKTEFIVFRSRFSEVTPNFPPLTVGKDSINISSTVRNLGAYFDQTMSLENHVTNLCRSANWQLRKISLMRNYLDNKTCEILVHAFVTSKLDFLNSLLFGLPDSTIKKLQKIQNTAARIVKRKGRKCRTTPLLKELHWLPISYRIQYKILLLTFCAHHLERPVYLSQLLLPYTPTRTLRSSNKLFLTVPKPGLKNYGYRSFQYSGSYLWNKLPDHIRTCYKLSTFKSLLKTHFFTCSFKHGRESRTVKHFHFTDWGDMKIPEFLDPILDFLKIVRNNTSQKKVPNTIVHCSAGVGRTGTYITLDAMLDMAQAEGKVNVYKFVTEMRQRRAQSVQVKEQYQFIFDTLVKNFCIGRTTMTVKSFGMALASLKRTNGETGETYLTEQFKILLKLTSDTPYLLDKLLMHFLAHSALNSRKKLTPTIYVYRNLPRAAGLASSVWPDQVHWPGHSFPVTCTAKSK
ncbi:reverse transcriptase-like protein [Apostichopus japonicus]|uniref:Reverse transcriptase-like protein n=1 Tax=Stichopus japonicus TaxID=307972 RepID=A0A2G8JS63_STIJA|nr:reverse transcriptase-like protein [Apostichopus japonicus]